MVRPNSEIIPPGHSVNVKILTQQNMSQETKKLIADRFLVQLAKLDQMPQNYQSGLSVDELSKLWQKISAEKEKIV